MGKEAKESVRVLVSGMVQGVYFRYHTRMVAERLGLTGFVRNLGDSRVEIMVEGRPEDLRRMVDWARQGPPSAHVDGVEIEWGQASGAYRVFEITW